MNDTVKRIMGLVDDVIAASHEINHDYTAERQVLEAELARLFTPLSQEAIVQGFCSEPHDVQLVSVFRSGVRWAEKQHGIGGG